ncbi:methyl-accepting chemotaxis protein [Brevibacillus ginsengisoli]|uniref:methyl-accepting chemotaxis protein n=1 Tax=Brevibacillus ginsengisoli TaxID=363854 RepID=UPI003CF896C2
MRSIKTKLLSVIIPIMCLALIGVVWLNNSKAQDFLEQNFREKSMVDLDYLTTKLNDSLQMHVERLSNIATGAEMTGMKPEAQIAYLKKKLIQYPEYTMLFVANDKGDTHTTEDKTANISERVYFKKIMEGESYQISDPVQSKTTGKLSIMVATPIKNNAGKTIGLVGTSFPISDLNKITEEVKIGQTGYAFLTQKDGLIISHPNQDLIMKRNITQLNVPKLKEAHEASQRGEKGSTRYIFEGVDKYTFYQQLPITGWNVMLTAPVVEASSQLSSLKKISFVTGLIAIILAGIVIFIFSSRLIRPIARMSELTSLVANGDLTIKVEHGANDEVGRLGDNFNQMIAKIQELLGQIDNVSIHIKSSSDTLAVSSQETKMSAEQVAVTISELASGTVEIASSVTNATHRVNDMIHTVNQIANHTDEVIFASNQSKESAQNGVGFADESIQKMAEVHDNVKKTSDIIEKLDERSKAIGNIVGMITSIADQTNLLALNASIEAARAGEHGRGFAVVAEEVRKLANETSESASQIAALIKETQKESQRAVESSQTGTRVAEEGAKTVQQAGKAFEEISTHIENVLSKNTEIYAAIKNLESLGKAVGENMEQISAVTQEASAGAEEVSAASQQQSAGANQISSDANSLADLGDELQHVINQFKIK